MLLISRRALHQTNFTDREVVLRTHVPLCRTLPLASAQGIAQATEALKRVDEIIRNDPRQALTRPTGRKKPKPNAPCSCGSGKKYKKCCGSNK